MKPTQTGIAVALALVVVIIFFVFPGLSPLQIGRQNNTAMKTSTTTVSTTTTQTASTTMTIENSNQLQITDESIGTGAVAAVGDTVTVNYVGAFTDGKVFDASANHGTTGFTFKLGAGQVIKGWDEGVVGMREGGKRKLI